MAAPTVKEILLKWGIDNTNWKKAILELSKLLEKENKAAESAAAKAAKSLDAQKAKLKEYIADQKSATAEIEKQISKLKLQGEAAKVAKAEAVAKLATEKATSSEYNKQSAAQRVQLLIQKNLQQEINTKLMNEKLVTAEINKQSAALRQQMLAARAAGGGGGGGGRRTTTGGGGFVGGIGRALAGMMGGGLFGNITAAVTSAEGLAHALEAVLEKARALAHEVGPLQQVREQFEKLAPARGINPTEFIEKLRTATHGLVDDIGLYRNANTFLQSSIHASESDIMALTAATVGLARAQGRDAASALQHLQRFFLTGRSMTLSYATGINRAYLAVGNLGRGTDTAIRTQLQFKQALEVVKAQFEAIGEPALTYNDAMKQVSVSTHRVMEEFMMGVTGSSNIQQVIEKISQLAKLIGSFAEKAHDAGKALAEIFSAQVMTQVVLWKVSWGLLVDTFENLKKDISELGGLFGWLIKLLPNSAVADLDARFSSFRGTITTVAEVVSALVAGFRELVNWIRFAAAAMPKLERALVESIPYIGRVAEYIDRLLHGKSAKTTLSEQLADTLKKEKEIADSLHRQYSELEGIRKNAPGQGDFKIKVSFAAALFTQQMQEDAAKKVAKVQEQIEITTSKIQLDRTKRRISDEEQLIKMQYEQGLFSHKDFLDKKRILEKADFDATILNLNNAHAAKMHFLEIEQQQTRRLNEERKFQAKEDYEQRQAEVALQRFQVGLQIQEAVDKGKRGQAGGITGEQGAKYLNDLEAQWTRLDKAIRDTRAATLKSIAADEAELNAKGLLEQKKHLEELEKARNAYQRKGNQLTEEEIKDELDARKKLVEAEKKIEEDRLARQRQDLEKGFKEGMVSANEYLAARVADINAEYEVSATASKKKLEGNKLSLTAMAEFNTEMVSAADRREKAITQLSNDEWDKRIQAADAAANRMRKILEGNLRYQEEVLKLNPYASRGEQIQQLTGLVDLESKRLVILREQARMLEQAKFPETYAKVHEELVKTQQSLLKYNEELIKARNLSTAVAEEAKNISTAASLFPKGGKTAELFTKFAQTTETLGKLRDAFEIRRMASKAPRQVPKTPQEILKALDDSMKKSSDVLSEASKKSSDELEKFRALIASSGGALDRAIKSQTDDIAQQIKAGGGLITATENLTVSTKNLGAAMDTVAGKMSPGLNYSGAQKYGTSGQASAEHPGGTATASDMQSLEDSIRSSTQSAQAPDLAGSLQPLAPAAMEATSAFQKFAASLKDFGGGFLQTTFGKDGLIGAFKNIGKDSKEASKDFGNFMGGIQMMAGMVGSMLQTFKQSGAAAGALSGAMSFGQFGNMIGGPIGGAIGAAIGAVVGAFSGAARAAAEKMAKEISASFKATMNEIQSGTQTLSAGIQLQIADIQKAVNQLSGKKGKDLLKKILPDMESELLKLKQQQQQTIKSIDDQLNILNAPNAYQEQLKSVDDIIKKYRDYVQAGGSVVNANQFLQDSFRNLSLEGYKQLNQDEQDAIDNALKYNQLLLDRQNLIQDTNQQIQDIMSQGVAVRQMPSGVSKARQIQQLMRDATQKMDSMNQEIAVADHKLRSEQQIFKLATTRIGLENQLTVLQNQQTDLDMQRIAALGNVLSKLGMALPTSVQGALQEFGLGAAYVSPGTEPSLKPIPPVKTGILEIDTQNQLEYQQAMAAWMLAMNQTIGYIPPSGYVATTPVPTSIPSAGGPSVWMQPGVNYSGSPTAPYGTSLSASDQLSMLTGMPSSQIASPTAFAAAASLTNNAEKVDTISTPQGTALLVSPAAGTYNAIPSNVLTPTTVPAGPGSTQVSGVIRSLVSTAAVATSAIAGSLPGNLPITTSSASALVSPAVLDVSSHRLSVERHIHSLSNVRVVQERQLVSLKMQEIAADMHRIHAHTELLKLSKGIGAAPNTLEDLLQNVYETRGRQGFGRFYGELANPT